MTKKTRRAFLVNGIQLVSSLSIVGLLGNSGVVHAKEKVDAAVPERETPVSESDPTASALGFHHDAIKTDFSRYPARKKSTAKNEYCKHCLQYNKLTDSWGKCSIVNTGVVSANGWCSAWSKKS
jgi:hypothetical protein